MEKYCYECKHHTAFIEDDGTHDGCLCYHEEAEKENQHFDNCFEYADDPKGDCPYFEED